MLSLLLLLSPGAPAPLPLPGPPWTTTATLCWDITEAVEKEIAAFDALFQAWVETYYAAEDDEARHAAIEKRPTADGTVAKLFGLIDQDPAGDGAFKALTWIMRADTSEVSQSLTRALQLVVKHHIGREELRELVMSLSYSRTKDIVPLLLTIAEKSPHHGSRGCATLSAGVILSRDPQSRERAVKLLKKVVAEFSDVTLYDGRLQLGKRATSEIYEIEHLQIGMVVPEIDGEDIDGVAFKLSDYRGKVVLLDFWGDW